MPATAITNWMTALSVPVAGFVKRACELVSRSGEAGFLGVRSCLLKYSDDVSRRMGVACLVRAIVVVETGE